MTQTEPVVTCFGVIQIGQVRPAPIPYIEQIPQHFYLPALLPLAQQCGYGNIQKLAQQIEQCGFESGDGMDGGAKVKSLVPAPARIAVCKLFAHRVEGVVPRTHGLAHDKRPGIFQRLPDALPARHFAHACLAGVVLQDHDIAREVRAMRAAQIEQHAVMPGHRDNLHGGNDRCFWGCF